MGQWDADVLTPRNSQSVSRRQPCIATLLLLLLLLLILLLFLPSSLPCSLVLSRPPCLFLQRASSLFPPFLLFTPPLPLSSLSFLLLLPPISSSSLFLLSPQTLSSSPPVGLARRGGGV
eukprot:3358646-Rhodomonas_salina.1